MQSKIVTVNDILLLLSRHARPIEKKAFGIFLSKDGPTGTQVPNADVPERHLLSHMVLQEPLSGSAVCIQYSVGVAGVPDFQKALEPLRQLLTEYPYLGGKDGPSYADDFVAGMFMVGPSSFIPRSFYSL